MKKQIYILGLATMLSYSANAQMVSKKPATEAENAKKKYEQLVSSCYDCERKVERDSIYGDEYKKMKTNARLVSDSVNVVNRKFNKALQILDEEIARNPYNTKAERNAYAKRKADLEKQRQSEIDEMYRKVKQAYIDLAQKQKSAYAAIVDREIQNSMSK